MQFGEFSWFGLASTSISPLFENILDCRCHDLVRNRKEISEVVRGDEERFEFCCIELFKKLGCLWPTVFLVAVELGNDASDISDLVVHLLLCQFIEPGSLQLCKKMSEAM